MPEDDAAFTAWYRQHVKQFFGVSGPDYDRLFGLHGLEHKTCGDPARASFDGLCCDGSGNYLKLLREGDGWKVADFKARSFKREAKAILAPWIVETYSSDRYEAPPPITESPSLLSYKDANRVGRRALEELEAPRSEAEREDDPVSIYFPLGLEWRRILAYKVIKPSAFLFRTPQQRAKFVKAMQKFADSTGCGLEVLSLRRGSEGRRKGSIVGCRRGDLPAHPRGRGEPDQGAEPDAFVQGTGCGAADPLPGDPAAQGRGGARRCSA